MFLLLRAFEVRSNVCFPVARRAEDLVTVGAGEGTDTWGIKTTPTTTDFIHPTLLACREEFANLVTEVLKA